MDDPKAKMTQWVASLSRGDARELLKVLVEHHSLANETSFQQDLFIANYLDNGCNIIKACKAVNIAYETYAAWKSDPEFIARLAFSEQSIVAELLAVARGKALDGDGDMLKFLLAAFDPEKYDSRFRSQVIANRGQLEAAMEGNRKFTEEEIRALIMNDPAQEFVPKDEIH